MTSGNLEGLSGSGVPSPDCFSAGASVRSAPCPVVGLGASAGGLEAFQNFLSGRSADARPGLRPGPAPRSQPRKHAGRAAQPTHRRCPSVRLPTAWRSSPTTSISSRRTRASHRECNAYGSPSSPSRAASAGLSTSSSAASPSTRAPTPPASCSPGTGGDGSEGLRAVKEAGGLTLVQDPDTAKYDGMPKSAVSTGLVDKVLARPSRCRRDTRLLRPRPGQHPQLSRRHGLPARGSARSCGTGSGHDFSQYKRSTMLRRIQRRMQVVGASDGAEYLESAARQARRGGPAVPRSADQRHLLLSRRRGLRLSCAAKSFPSCCADKGAGDTVRIWAPGCSSGEEAYSIAILMAEALVAPAGAADGADLRHRHRRADAAEGARRQLPALRREGRAARAARPLLLRAGRRLRSDAVDPRHGAGLQPQSDQGSAVLARRHDRLPQPADLPQLRAYSSA